MAMTITRPGDRVAVAPVPPIEPAMPGFGTDGIRGRANHEISPMLAMRLGRAVAISLRRDAGRLVVARDTRRSGDMLTAALIAGATSMGVDVVSLGVAPTAALAFVAARWRYDAGIMVSASHNPAEDNGLKVLDTHGLKLDEAGERRLEQLMRQADSLPTPGNHGMGVQIEATEELDRYRAHRMAIATRMRVPVRVVVDCANGSASTFAADILAATGAQVTTFAAAPNGSNINQDCGATAPGALAAAVRASSADLGFAFDGDADRCVVVDETGAVVDGDALLGMLALDRLARGALDGGTLVATVLSNGGLDATLRSHGGSLIRTPVGDRSVWEGMAGSGAILGGEKSGHVIVREHCSTGDGIVTALQVLDIVGRTQRSVSHLAAATTLWPQEQRAVRVAERATFGSDAVVQDAILDAQRTLAGRGRVLVRPSGTEPVIRIMVEGQDGAPVSGIADALAELVRQRHSNS